MFIARIHYFWFWVVIITKKVNKPNPSKANLAAFTVYIFIVVHLHVVLQHTLFFLIRTSKFRPSLVLLKFLHNLNFNSVFLNYSCFHNVSYHRKHVGNPNRVLPAAKTQFCAKILVTLLQHRVVFFNRNCSY